MSEGVDEGEKKGGGNKRKEVDQEEIGGRKKKAKPGQERRGESRGLWTRDKGLLSRTLQRAIGGRGRKALRAGLYLGRYCTVQLGCTYGWGPLGTGLR